MNYGVCPDVWFAVCENTERDCLERRQWLVDNDMVWLLKALKDRVKDLNDEEVWKYWVEKFNSTHETQRQKTLVPGQGIQIFKLVPGQGIQICFPCFLIPKKPAETESPFFQSLTQTHVAFVFDFGKERFRLKQSLRESKFEKFQTT